MTTERELLEAVERLLETDDDTGCDGDLTVVAKSAVERLRKLLSGWPPVSAVVRFLPEDVVDMAKEKRVELGKEEASDWLHDNRRHVEQAMTERGFAAIRDLLEER